MADRNIKGITVEIGGDTTGLDKALQDTETNSKKAASELRSINKALEDAPQNAVLWQQKQVVLNKALEESKKKLEVLQTSQKSLSQKLADGDIDKAQYDKFQEKLEKSRKNLDELNKSQADMKRQFDSGEIDKNAYEKFQEKIKKAEKAVKDLENAERSMEEKVKAGDISEDQYRAFQRELEKSKSEVNKFETQVESVNQDIENLGKVSDDTAEEVQELGESSDKASNGGIKTLAVGVAALTAAAYKAVQTADELSQSYDILVKKTGATGESLDALKENANNIFVNIPTDMDKAATAVGEVNTRFAVTGETLENLSEEFIKFAEINDTDLNNSIGKTDKIMEQWNVDISETDNLLGFITKKAQDTGISVDTLMDSVQKNGSTFKEMDFSLEQSISLLADFEANGVNADTAIAGLRKGTANASKDGKSLSDALTETVSGIKNAKTETEALEKAQELFGTKGAAEMARAIREGRVELTGLSADMSNYGNLVSDTYDSTVSDMEEMQKVENAAKLAIAEFGNELTKKVLKPAVENLPKLIETGKQMLPVIKAVGIGFATWKIGGLAKDGASAFKDLISKIKDLGKGSISTGTAVQGTLAATTAAVMFASEAYEKWYQNQHAAMIEADKYKKSVEESSAQLNNLKESAYQSASAELEQIDKTRALWKELQNLSDASGNVKAKDQERAEYIIGELEQATGIEIGYIDGQIQKYQELTGEIDKVIEKKKAETLINSFDSVYTEARTQAGQAQSEYYEAKKKYDALKAADDAANSGKMFNGGIGSQQYSEETRAAEIEMNAAKEKYLNATDELSAYTRAEEAYEQGHYDMVESILYSDLDANAKTVRDFNNSTQEREESFRDMCDSMLSNLKLANSAQSKEMQQSTANIMTELVSAYTDGGFDSAIGFSTEFIEEMQKALADGVNFDSFIEAVGDSLKGTGKTIGEILGSEAAARYQEIISERMTLHTQQLYANNNLIQKTINSQSDANLYRDGNYGTPKMATGGILNYGKAIVAEAGPELLQLTNQGVQVTPLTQTARNHALSSISGGGDTYNQHITVNVQKISSDYDVRRIAQQMADELKRTRRGGGK